MKTADQWSVWPTSNFPEMSLSERNLIIDYAMEQQKRELKFRVWNGAEMVYDVTVGKFGVFYVNPSNNGLDEKDSASLTPFNTKYNYDIHVMQFTGLTDKSGLEIFEGDILRHYAGYLKKVEWGHHLWVFITINRQPNKEYQTAAFPNQFEVIGNIYQNPELLK